MSLIEHEVKIRAGRRDGDGQIRVSVFMSELLALTLEGHGERAPTLLLTLEQARRLKDALAELIPLAEEAAGKETKMAGAWEGKERRRQSA